MVPAFSVQLCPAQIYNSYRLFYVYAVIQNPSNWLRLNFFFFFSVGTNIWSFSFQNVSRWRNLGHYQEKKPGEGVWDLETDWQRDLWRSVQGTANQGWREEVEKEKWPTWCQPKAFYTHLVSVIKLFPSYPLSLTPSALVPLPLTPSSHTLFSSHPLLLTSSPPHNHTPY